MGEERYVGHHLVVIELVALGGLDDAVQRHHAAKLCIVEDHQVLMIGPMLEVDLVNGKALAVGVVERFGESVTRHRSRPAGVPPPRAAAVQRFFSALLRQVRALHRRT